MLKKAKLYSLLAIIVTSTLVSLFGFSQTAFADVMSWTNGGLGDPDDGIITYASETGSSPTSQDCQQGKYVKTENDAASASVGGASFNDFNDNDGNPPQIFSCALDNGDYRLIFLPGNLDLDNLDPDSEPSGWLVEYKRSGDKYVQDGIGSSITFDFTPAVGSDVEYSDPGEEKDTSPSSCQIKGIGWVVCPIVMFVAEVIDQSYAILDHTLLKVEPLVLPGGDENEGIALYNTWKSMRDFANIIFIIGFLLIVFSQLTSIGISNYGIKRLLPKIVICAILVNVSFYICVVAVDLSNILGNSLRGVFDSVVSTNESGGAFSFTYTTAGDSCGGQCDEVTLTSWQQLVYVVIGGAGIVGAIALSGASLYVFLPVLLPMIIGAVVAILTVVIALTIRQALIVLLVVISPLAFVALLLPNTEDYFKKWRSLFTAMLLVYPIISVVFGASALASRILMSTNDFAVQLVGAGVSIIPLFLTPIIMKVSGGLLNRWVGLVNDPSKGFFDSKRNALAEQGQIIAANRRAGSVRRVGNWVSGTSRGRVRGALLGGANSRRRSALALTSAYGAETRKDGLKAAESDIESSYLSTEGGRQARNASKNAQINLQSAQLNTESVRLNSAEGITLQVDNLAAETRKRAAEDRAQTAAIGAVSAMGLTADSKRAELGKQLAETQSQTAAINAMPARISEQLEQANVEKREADDTFKSSGIAAVAGSTAGQAALARAEDAKTELHIAETESQRVALAGASHTLEADAKEADINLERQKSLSDANATEIVNSRATGQAALAARKDAETKKNTAEIISNTIASQGASRVLEAQEKLANIENEAETNLADAASTRIVNSSPTGQAMQGRALDATRTKQIADDESKMLSIDHSDIQTMVQAETSSQDLANMQSLDKQTYTEIAAEGAGSVSRGLGISDAEATAAQNSSFQAKAIDSATFTARSQGESNFAEAINTNPTLLREAGGNVNRVRGESRARARAATTVNKDEAEAVDNETQTMSRTALDPTKVVTVGDPDLETIMMDTRESVERRAAAAVMRIRRGGDEDIIKTINYMGSAPLDDEMRTIQQYVFPEISKRSQIAIGAATMAQGNAGEFHPVIVPGTRTARPDRTNTDTPMDALARARLTGGKFNPISLAKAPAAQVDHMVDVVENGVDRASVISHANFIQLQADLTKYLADIDSRPESERPTPEMLEKLIRIRDAK